MENAVIEYIEQARQHGLPEKEIKQNLLDAGWDAAAVENAFAYARAAENRADDSEKISHLESDRIEFKQSLRVSGLYKPASESLTSVNTLQAAAQPQLPVAAKKTAVRALLILIILAFGAAAYAAYGYYFNNPQKIFEKMLAKGMTEISSGNFSVSYKSPRLSDGKDGIDADVSGKEYYSIKSADKTKIKAEISGNFTEYGAVNSKKINLVITDGQLYLKIGGIPETEKSGGAQVDWLKLDMPKLWQLASSTLPAAGDYNAKISAARSKLKQNFQKNNFITADKKIEREEYEGSPVYHIYLKLNNEKLAAFVNQFLEDFKNSGKAPANAADSEIDDRFYSEIGKNMRAFLEKFQVKQWEIWVNRKDYTLQKVLFVSNAPDLSGKDFQNMPGVFAANANTEARNRDQTRLADMKKTASALETYKAANGGYPNGSNGVPVGLSPNFITKIPVAPQAADGNCTEYYNTYWYEPAGEPAVVKGIKIFPDYQYTFCLGSASGNLLGGIVKMTPSGSENISQCPDTDLGKCYKSAQPSGATAAADNFGAELKFDYGPFDIGIEKEVMPPQDAYDIMQTPDKSQRSSQ